MEHPVQSYIYRIISVSIDEWFFSIPPRFDNAAYVTERSRAVLLTVACQLWEHILHQASGLFGVLKNRGLSTTRGSRVVCIDRGEFMASSWRDFTPPMRQCTCLTLQRNENCTSQQKRHSVRTDSFPLRLTSWSYISTDNQSTSPSWCQAPICDPRSIFLSPWNFL
jgi:hypothetical protein